MPIISDSEGAYRDAPPLYFKSLTELDDWDERSKHRCDFDHVIPYYQREKDSTPDTRGKLLVCHDYKGGYSESPSSLAYTFNFWDRCSSFIYFSHHRVTVPPPGWINAAHRQGCKILGVLIFEHEQSDEDGIRLLIGKAPLKSKTGAARPHPDLLRSFPISKHYAALLADLARERGFDGYLLNFERDFLGRSEQVRAVEAWILILKTELERKVGSHAETIWYDSIVTTGEVRWQNRLNSRNVSFFLASDALFTNYWWPSPYPSICAQYLLSMDADALQDRPKKSFRDIYMGIDVWGRGSHGNGGMALYKAAEHVDPEFMGLSLAVFGPGWTWESDEGNDDWSWAKWWERERTLWTGPEIEGASVEVPDWPQRQGEPPCEHGKFRPVSDFFTSTPPPNPSALAFYTSFSPGVGFSWFVEGKSVMTKTTGWTDVDKQTSLGDLLWPRPIVSWEDQALDAVLPKATNTVDFLDAFNGGSSLKLTLQGKGSKTDDNAFQCFWIPIQSLTLSIDQLYEVQLIYKVSSEDCDLDLALSAKMSRDDVNLEVHPVSGDIVDNFANGWSKASITCKANGRAEDSVRVSIGIVLGAAFNDTTLPYSINIHLGQLAVFPRSSTKNAVAYEAKLLWADCERETLPNVNSASVDTLSLSWDMTVSFTTPALLRNVDLMPETPRPPWILDRSPQWYPRQLYANIYGEKRDSAGEKRFLGTSGAVGGPNRFAINHDALPAELREGTTRFYVQAVTDRGAVLPWERCVYVDYDWSTGRIHGISAHPFVHA